MINDLWTGILDTIAQVVIPVWNDLIQYLPLLVVFAILGILGAVIWMWQVNRAGNASRVPKPIPAGRKPEEMHLPGPSAWPLVAPVGLLFIVFAVALGPAESLLNLGILLAGMSIAVVGLLGWYLDAGKEYVTVEAGGHGTPDETAQVPGWSLAPPEGMHLPGPSAWPLLAPVGLLFLASGLVFGPAMFIGGADHGGHRHDRAGCSTPDESSMTWRSTATPRRPTVTPRRPGRNASSRSTSSSVPSPSA